MLLLKYSVLIKKVPTPIVRIKMIVWFCGRNKLSRLVRAIKPHECGKYFLINVIKPFAVPASIEKVITNPIKKDSA